MNDKKITILNIVLLVINLVLIGFNCYKIFKLDVSDKKENVKNGYVISTAEKASFESSAKLIANNAEEKLIEQEVLDVSW